MSAEINCVVDGVAPIQAPDVDGAGPAIRIAAHSRPGFAGTWAFGLSVGYRLPLLLIANTRRIASALVLTLEDPDGRARGVVRLGEPGADPPSPNFHGDPISFGPGCSTMESAVAMMVHVVRDPTLQATELVARVALQCLMSPPIRVPVPQAAS